MAERGAVPNVSSGRRRALELVRSFTSPLLPDDYLELINPLWSTRELRGRIERIERETPDAVTVLIKPGLGVARPSSRTVPAPRASRSTASTTGAPTRSPRTRGEPTGCIAITVKHVEGGKVSPFFVGHVRPGTIVRLGERRGRVRAARRRCPSELLFVSAGSGITPIMSMLRELDQQRRARDAVHIHSSPRHATTSSSAASCAELAQRQPGLSPARLHTGEQRRLTPAEDSTSLSADWREREAFLSGPASCSTTLEEHWKQAGCHERLHMERFQPDIGVGDGERGSGGTITSASELEAECDGEQPILVGGEEAGATLPFGCRMGICHTCVGRAARRAGPRPAHRRASTARPAER